MQLLFTYMQRALLLLLAFVLLPEWAHAEYTKKAGINAELRTAPTGAGKVYARVDSTFKSNTPDADFTTPAEQIRINGTVENGVGTCKAFAVPADSLVFAGWTAAEKVDDSTFVRTDNVLSRSTTIELLALPTTKDSQWPDTVFYAVFSAVAPRVAAGHEAMGNVATDTLLNHVGQRVTLTARPTEATRFAYWVNRTTGDTLRQNPLTVTVTAAAYYDAHFRAASPTAIDRVPASATKRRRGIYDLQGHKLHSIPTRGLYILDGELRLAGE